MSSLYKPTPLVALTEYGILDVYVKDGCHYVGVEYEAFRGYEYIHKDAVMTKDEAKRKYPEELI